VVFCARSPTMIRSSLLALAACFAACSPTRASDAPSEPSVESVEQEIGSTYHSHSPDSPTHAQVSGAAGADGWSGFIAGYPTYTIVRITPTGVVRIVHECPDNDPAIGACIPGNCHGADGSLAPPGRILFPNTCTGYGAMFVHWRTEDGSFQQWDACRAAIGGGSYYAMVRSAVSGGRASDTSFSIDCRNCCASPCYCDLGYHPGGDTISLDRLGANLVVTASKTEVPWKSLVEVYASPDPPTLVGLGTPLYLVKHEWKPDEPPKADGGEEEEVACERMQGNTCLHRMFGSGTMMVGAMVNGQYQEKSIHLTAKCGPGTCKCDDPIQVKTTKGGSFGVLPLKTPCRGLGTDYLGVDLAVEGKYTTAPANCHSDCEAESSLEGKLTFKALLCGKEKSAEFGIEGFHKEKACQVCNDSCKLVCGDVGCVTDGLKASGGIEVSQEFEPKFIRAINERVQKLHVPGLAFDCGLVGKVGLNASVAYDETKKKAACPECEDCGSTTTTLGGSLGGELSCEIRGGVQPENCKYCRGGRRPGPGDVNFSVGGVAGGEFSGSIRGQWGACGAKTCGSIGQKLTFGGHAKVSASLLFYEAALDCNYGGSYCTELNTCTNQCDACEKSEDGLSCEKFKWDESCTISHDWSARVRKNGAVKPK
jgi:hypothetical protein